MEKRCTSGVEMIDQDCLWLLGVSPLFHFGLCQKLAKFWMQSYLISLQNKLKEQNDLKIPRRGKQVKKWREKKGQKKKSWALFGKSFYPSNPIQPLILRFLILLFNKTPTIDKSEQEYYKGRSWSPRQACQSNLTPDPAMSPHVSITTPPSSGTPPPPCQLHAFRPCYRKYPTPHMRRI